jgi:hypothetical protein
MIAAKQAPVSTSETRNRITRIPPNYCSGQFRGTHKARRNHGRRKQKELEQRPFQLLSQ